MVGPGCPASTAALFVEGPGALLAAVAERAGKAADAARSAGHLQEGVIKLEVGRGEAARCRCQAGCSFWQCPLGVDRFCPQAFRGNLDPVLRHAPSTALLAVCYTYEALQRLVVRGLLSGASHQQRIGKKPDLSAAHWDGTLACWAPQEQRAPAHLLLCPRHHAAPRRRPPHETT